MHLQLIEILNAKKAIITVNGVRLLAIIKDENIALWAWGYVKAFGITSEGWCEKAPIEIRNNVFIVEAIYTFVEKATN